MIRRGEIYFAPLDPVVGREQGGRRPVLVVSSDPINAAPLVVAVIPGTAGRNVPRDYPSNVRAAPGESGLSIETVFLGLRIRSLDHSRFPRTPSGRLSPSKMAEVDEALRMTLALPR